MNINSLSEEIRHMFAIALMGLAVIAVVGWLGSSLSTHLFSLTKNSSPNATPSSVPTAKESATAPLSPIGGIADSFKGTAFVFGERNTGAVSFFASIGTHAVKIGDSVARAAGDVKNFFYDQLSRNIGGKTIKPVQ